MNLDRFRPAFASDDSVRFCGLRIDVIAEALNDPKVVDALMVEARVKGKPAHLKALSLAEKLAAIEHEIGVSKSTKTSEWYDVPEAEILAAHLWNASESNRRLQHLFCEVRKERDLLAPVAAWLRKRGLDAFQEVHLGRCRVDALGHREGGFLKSKRSVAVELKNEHEQVKRGLDQIATYRDYCHEVYMACTPGMVADQLVRHVEGKAVRRWDHDVFYRRLWDLGFGLLIVEGRNVYEFIQPREIRPTDSKFDELVATLKTAKRV